VPTTSLRRGYQKRPVTRSLAVVSRSSRDGGYGEYPILTIQPAKGEALAVHCTNVAIKAKVIEKNPQAGDEIGIRFLGEATSKTGNTYKNFKVVVKKSTIESALDSDAPF
jgi:hypothetical protein